MTRIRVSLVIPARNAQATLPAVLAAAGPQVAARGDAEAIVVDNGSDDRTQEIAARSGARVLERPRPGAAGARNTGWQAARGELVVFLDSDCIPQAGWLDRLVQALDDAPSAGAAGGTVRAAPPTGLLQRHAARVGYYFNQAQALNDPFMPFLLIGNSCYRRSVLERLGGLDEGLHSGEDADLTWRMQLDLGLIPVLAPDAVVEHVHRETLRGIWRQWARYGYGAVQLEARYPGRRVPPGPPSRLVRRLFRALAASAAALAGLPRGRSELEDVVAPLLRCFEAAATRAGRFRARRARARGLGD
jgi:cellulose synthase/poly-beta-1,6-N-acetylglucosamine synthase-like glycosyltransferase